MNVLMFYNPFQKNKTPGNDGLTVEFFVAFLVFDWKAPNRLHQLLL